MTKRILICGYGDSGKDECLSYLASITGLRNGGSTSLYIAPYAAEELGVSVDEAYAERRSHRALWNRIAREKRAEEPGYFIRKALAVGPLIGGCRDIEEIQAARQNDMIDFVIWLENKRVAPEEFVKLGPDDCDSTITNNGTLDELRMKLRRFAKFAGLC